MAKMSPETKLLAFADSPSECEAEQLVRAGAHGYLSVTSMPQLVAKAIRVVLEGDIWVGRRTLLHLIEELRDLAFQKTVGDRQRTRAKLAATDVRGNGNVAAIAASMAVPPDSSTCSAAMVLEAN